MTTAEHAAEAMATAEPSVRKSIRFWAMAALVAFVAAIAAFAGFMTVGGVFYTISDGIALLQAIAFVPLILGIDTVLSGAGSLARTGKWLGLVGCALVGVGSIVLLTSEVTHEFVPAGGGLGMQFAGFGLIGAWFLVQGIISRRHGVFGATTTWSTLVLGAGFVIGGLGSPMGPDSIAVTIGMALGFLGFFVWVFSIRKEMKAS